jgi:hypothetical protein
MAGEKDSLGDRGRSLEDDYFRRKDRELLDRAREQEALAASRRELAESLGVDEDATIAALASLGFGATTAPLLEIVPAVQVGWADGSLPAAERAEIERLLAQPSRQAAAQAGSRMVNEWLARPLGADVSRLATEALRLRAARLDGEARTSFVRRIVEDCNAVAGASGGVFGVGARSSAEADRIREIAAALGAKA